MKRFDLEHIIRAAGSIVGDDEIVVIGSQAILAQFPNAPGDKLRSIEADIFPKNKPQLADLIDGSIGELSPFHMRFGDCARGVEKKTAVLPEGRCSQSGGAGSPPASSSSWTELGRVWRIPSLSSYLID